MAETTGSSSFPAATSKICWFNLSSLLFKSSSSSSSSSASSQDAQLSVQQQQQTPSSSPNHRRTSPRLSNKPSTSDSIPTLNQCCLVSNSKCHCSVSTSTTKRKHAKTQQTSNGKKQQKEHSSTKDNDSSDDGDSSMLSCQCTGAAASSSNGLNDHVCCQGHRHQNLNKSQQQVTTHGLSLKEAPHYLTFNPYITGGYRNNLRPVECIKSLFWWTNETLNIWSHLLGWVWFFALSIYDMMGLTNLPKTQPWDQVIISLLLVCFQACMILSAAYHVFCCCSEQSYRQWLTMDLLGVSLSLLAIYISGIYYAFSCVPFWLNFYLSTVAAIFVCCLTCTFFRSSDGFSNRLILFGGWACYGIVPTVHWAILHGGIGGNSSAVALLLPRIFWMYAISAAAFFFYVSKLPERWKPGLVNYIGSSHQIWHILIVAALYHWHNTGMVYLEYRARHPCSEEYASLYKTDVTKVQTMLEN